LNLEPLRARGRALLCTVREREFWIDLGLRTLHLLVRAWAGFAPWAAGLGYRLVRHGLRTAFLLAFLAAAVLALVRAVPVAYGRLELIHQAGEAARQIHLKGEPEVRLELRRKAFAFGLDEAAFDEQVFHVEMVGVEGVEMCSVSFDFIHQVPVLGAWRVPVRIRGGAVELPVEPRKVSEESDWGN